MILTPRKKRSCPEHCKCGKHKNSLLIKVPAQNYDPSLDVNGPSTLEEHFENFADGVAEVAENFLGLGKRAKQRKQERHEVKTMKKLAKVDIKKARAERIRLKGQAEANRPSLIEQQQIKNAGDNLQAQQQADQVNQLASQVQPASQPVSPAQVPQASGSGTSEQLYKTLPMTTGTAEAPQEAPAQPQTGTEQEETAKGEATTTAPEAPKKNKMLIYIVIAVAIIGVWYLMKKK